MKHYIGKAKFELKNELGEKMIVGPDSFHDIPDSFQGDPTYKMAVAAGVIQPFITVKEGDKAQEKANAKGGKKGDKAADEGGKKGDKAKDEGGAGSEETAPENL